MRTVSDIIVGQVLEKVRPKNLIIDALGRMETKRIGSLLVFEGDEFRGIVTMTDIALEYGKKGGCVEDIMTTAEKVIFVTPGDNLGTCGELLRNHNIHHLVVKDAGRIIGVVSSIDLTVAENEEKEEAAEAAKNLSPS